MNEKTILTYTISLSLSPYEADKPGISRQEKACLVTYDVAIPKNINYITNSLETGEWRNQK